MADHEAEQPPLVPTRPKNLPRRVLQAIDCAMHVANIARKLRPTIAALCRHVSQSRPFDAVFAKKESLAARTGASVETVYRHLKALKAAGLIEVQEQERKSRNGRFAIARIRLTVKAAGLLGFVEVEPPLQACDTLLEPPDSVPDAASTASAAAQAGACCSNADDAPPNPPAVPPAAPTPPCAPAASARNARPKTPVETPLVHTPPTVKMPYGQTLTEPTNSKHQLPRRTQNGLPNDLAWLTGNGLSRAGIFCLMGLAKTAKKRLSDITTAVYSRIRGLTGSALFAYLAALCKGPSDFAAAAAAERSRQAAQEAAAALRRQAAIFRQRFKGVALANRAQTILYLIDARCAFAQVLGENRHATTMPLNDLKPWIDGIASGRLVMATASLE